MKPVLIILLLIFNGLPHYSYAQSNSDTELILSKEEVAEIIQNTALALQHTYLYPQRTIKTASALLSAQRLGEFDRSFKFGRLKQKLESTLIQASDDSGFELVKKGSPNPMNAEVDRTNSNSIKLEILSGNIGYLGLTGNFVFSDLENDITKAFEYMVGTDAMIIDLRGAGDGTLILAQQIVSYFVLPDTLLGDVYFNPSMKMQQITALDTPKALYQFRQDFPLFILNSSFVAGPWEFMGYTLKHLNKATLVGEDTMGVSAMKKSIPVSEHVSLKLAYAYITNPKTGENWQQNGVFADYQTTSEESFNFAVSLATNAIETQD